MDDLFYMEILDKRIPDQKVQAFVDEFMNEMTIAFPKTMIHFEVSSELVLRPTARYSDSYLLYSRILKGPFSTDNTFKYLERFSISLYRNPTILLSGFLNAARLSSAASGCPLLKSHWVLFSAEISWYGGSCFLQAPGNTLLNSGLLIFKGSCTMLADVTKSVRSY